MQLFQKDFDKEKTSVDALWQEIHTQSAEKHSSHQYYCTNSINSSVTRHRGSEIDEILTGHRSQGPATKSPGQSKNWVLFLLKINFLSS